MNQTIKITRKGNDLELVKDIQSGIPSKVRAAQERIYKEYHPIFFTQMMRNVKCRKEAEDLTIQILTKALVQIEKFNQSYAFSTWIQSIAINLLIDFKRKNTILTQSIGEIRKTTDGNYMEMDVEDLTSNPLDNFIQQENHIELNVKLNNISEDSQTLLSLRYFEELSYNEIADKLQMPIGTVKAKLHRAKEELKQQYL
jgi:RNA polymerase sigma-70 factor (ECF subfamily)